ncbi:hypothetical protein [Flavobacterium pedocola]
MKRNLPFLLLLSFLFFSCKPHVEVKFTNRSNEEIKKLKVIIADKEFNFESLQKGETTAPLKLEETYQYCYAEVITAKDTLIKKPMICGNETKYTIGKLDFEIIIEDESKLDKNKRAVMVYPTEESAMTLQIGED